MRMFKDFFETGSFVQNLNTTFIVMVPKKGGGGGGGGGGEGAQRSLRIIGQ